MPATRLRQFVAAAFCALLVLTGCSGGGGGAPVMVAETARGGSATVAEANAFSSFNPYSRAGNTDINSKIGYITHSGFFYLDSNFVVVRNEKFGKYQKVSDDPLKVRYTVNEGVRWSDGAQVDAGDLLLAWAAGSGYFDDADATAGTGTRYFAAAADTTGLAGTVLPELGDDGRSITLEYARPYADWEVAFDVGLPAHVVAEKSGLNDEEDLVDLIRDSPRGDPANPRTNPQLKRVADFWNTGFDAASLPDDPALYLSNGPYVVQDMVPGVSLRLVRNRDYTWGPEPWLDEINVRYTGDAEDAVEALRNGRADIISPQPAAGLQGLFAGLEQQGKTVERYSQSGYDHLDLNFSGPFADRDVREAFLKTVPRQEIVDAVVGGLVPGATPLNSHVFLPGQPKYDKTVQDNGSSAYGDVDVDGARELLDGQTPTVRILYNRDNPNRTKAFNLIRDSAELAGFTVMDAGLGSADWADALGGDGHDAALLGWIGSGLGVSRVPQIFRTGAGSNFTGFSDPDADKLMEELAGTPDLERQDGLLADIDRRIWENAYGLPLYQTVGTTAFSTEITGVKTSPGPLGVWWNAWDWRLA